ncbi:AAA family ATPase peroxin 1 [Ascoidea rubescens DSM 1968]|uniref:Peroxisomal ATPase PEX1 n=1 Tax=Ascoidea rubescens DSM 1968 TaxID=1344418 RepID=A0A1D2VEV7_9ASCO|nr:AAA-domain-containing protein [Ascoidea rubescens DSM 1968]ODV60043.1 AAA-domain-containing protein [Ascoidea rubescens DSM 1968]
MENVDVLVLFTSLRNNLINLPSNLVSLLYSANINVQNVIVELAWKNKLSKRIQYAYTGWTGITSSPPISSSSTNGPPTNSIEIDPFFANSIGLLENSKIKLSIKLNYKTVFKIFLEPLSSSDWELVELHATYLENHLLNQTRTVKLNQILIVYPTSTTFAKLKIIKTDPVLKRPLDYAKISPDCEIIISPKVRSNSNPKKNLKSTRSNSSIKKIYYENIPSIVLRSISLPHNLPSLKPNSTNDSTTNDNKFNVYINFNENINNLNTPTHVYVSVVTGPQPINLSIVSNHNQTNQNTTRSERRSNKNSRSASKIVCQLLHNPNIPSNHIALSELLSISLGISNSVGHLILIESISSTNQLLAPLSKKPKDLIIHSFIITTSPSNASTSTSTNNNDLVLSNKLQNNDQRKNELNLILSHLNKIKFFDSNCLTNYSRIPAISQSILPNGGIIEFSLNQNSLSYNSWFISESFKDLNIKLSNDILIPVSSIPKFNPNNFDHKFVFSTNSNTVDFNSNSNTDNENVDDKLIGMKDLSEKLIDFLYHDLNILLLSGASGSGKTLLINHLKKQIFNESLYKIFSLNCEELSNDNFDTMKKKFSQIFKYITWYSPSVLILENINSIFTKEMDNMDNSLSRQLTEYFTNNVLLILENQLKDLNINNKIKIILTNNSKDNLNGLLNNVIDDIVSISPPNKEQRTLIIDYYLEKFKITKNEKEFNLNDLVNETEGYLPTDLKVLIDRAYHEIIYESLENDLGIDLTDTDSDDESDIDSDYKNNHFKKALEGFTPSGLRGIQLQKSSTSWNDIGGLKTVKSVLLETLEWPTRYAPIFKSCPLRLRSGILLYGYPGCGKTLLASAVASQCGLNFISIKGPEILNKYIGASEQTVRELFERASAAKPCILFFDEFDSIAPKRGHDSTGVTDRVVNQLLTQMDGAEGLDGVYVLAATSRPDLIDSALLRPGRLDKSVLCNMPDFEDRLDILRSITNKMDLEGGVELDRISEKTEGFSGADLQALGYNAYLKAVHRKLENDEKEKEEASSSENKRSDSRSTAFDFFQISLNKLNNNENPLQTKERIEILRSIEPLFNNLNRTQGKRPASDDNKHKKGKLSITIKIKDFESALEETKPSVLLSERQKLEAIYKEFLSERDGNMPDGSASNSIGGRTTLM